MATVTGVKMVTLVPILVSARVRYNLRYLYVLSYQIRFKITSEGGDCEEMISHK